DFGQDLGLGLGIPGTNGTSVVQSGLPYFAIGAAGATGYNIGTTPNWMPLFRHERSYTFSTALTKVYQQHDVRLGVDIVRHQLNKWYLAPRLGAMYRFGEKGVARVGYGRTINPLPWSRPMRGSFPQDIFYNRTSDQFVPIGTLEQGIPPVPIPDISSGRVPLPRGVFMRSPNPTDVDRGVIQQWNVAYEHRLPWDIAAEVAYVGTRTDGGYADLDLNYGVPGGGNASRQDFALAGTTALNDLASRT